ncbi:uncharacterized protein A4U43_C02F16660 [Asparagus officinalis]|uniref:Uncharacterized protein n=1 Tax=Asparagus officinalis TaxID=4686 RepID=A0A5P1FJM1_ASPOF|nr:uncharacterized protein A4U43_C02F16660 [Asparagus officinalis]
MSSAEDPSTPNSTTGSESPTDDEHDVSHMEKLLRNGDFYMGQWRNDLPNGTGKYLWTVSCLRHINTFFMESTKKRRAKGLEDYKKAHQLGAPNLTLNEYEMTGEDIKDLHWASLAEDMYTRIPQEDSFPLYVLAQAIYDSNELDHYHPTIGITIDDGWTQI